MKALKKLLILGLGFSLVSSSFSATFRVSGNHRWGGNVFNDLDLGTASGGTASFMEHRLLLRPDVVVDERFRIRTEFNMLAHNSFQQQVGFSDNVFLGGAPLDGRAGSDNTNADRTMNLQVTRAYLEWLSDYGVIRAGRMPKAWGLGLLYDSGNNVEDYASTIVDRVSLDAQVGSLTLKLGFEKSDEGNEINDNDDDVERYEGAIEYNNPGIKLDVGLLYSRTMRNIRSAPILDPNNPLSNSNDFSFFVRKRWSDFTLGAEFATLSFEDHGDVWGGLGQLRWVPGAWSLGLDVAYASSDDDMSFMIHPNYRPFMILYSQNLVNQSNTAAAISQPVGGDLNVPLGGTAATSAGKGALLGKLSLGRAFKQGRYKLVVDGGYAQTIDAGTTDEKDLGMEVDAHFHWQMYKNFKTVFSAGVLFPGEAFVQDPDTTWGMQLRTYLTF